MIDEIKAEIEICFDKELYNELPDLIKSYKLCIHSLKEPQKMLHKTYINTVEKKYADIKVKQLCDMQKNMPKYNKNEVSPHIQQSNTQNHNIQKTSLERLRESQSILDETEKVGDAILNNLHDQHKLLDRVRQNLHEVQAKELPKASKHVRNMEKPWRG